MIKKSKKVYFFSHVARFFCFFSIVITIFFVSYRILSRRNSVNQIASKSVDIPTAKTYIAPITLLGQRHDLSIDNELTTLISKMGYGSSNVALGFSFGYNYTQDQMSSGSSTGYLVNTSQLEKLILASKKYKLPMLMHANGHKWVYINHLENEDTVKAWDQNGKPFTSLPKYQESNLAVRSGSWIWSLNEFNRKYLDLKEKNFRAVARKLAIFNQTDPSLVIGMTLDSEVSLLYALTHTERLYSFDYNPQTILQWQMYLAGTNWTPSLSVEKSPYLNDGWLAGKGKNLSLQQINSRYQTNYKSFLEITAPRADESTLVSPFTNPIKPINGTPLVLWEDWQIFKETLVKNFLTKMVKWAVEEGLPASKVYTHQALFLPLPNQKNAFTGNIITTGNIPTAGYGIDLYNEDTTNLSIMQAIKSLNSNWAIPEWNPGVTQNSIDALNIAWNSGVKVVSPNYFLTKDPVGFEFSSLNFLYNKDVTGKLIVDQIKDFISIKSGTNKHIAGYVDAFSNGRLLGWFCDLSEPNRPIQVQVKNSQDKIIATAIAEELRDPAVAKACNSSHSYHGFVINIADKVALKDKQFFVTATNPSNNLQRIIEYSPISKQQETTTPTGEFTETTSTSIHGWFDAISNNAMSGWACDSTQPGKHLKLAIVVNKNLPNTSILFNIANSSRSPIIKTFCSSTHSNHGYIIPLPSNLKKGDEVRIFALDEKGYVELKGSPKIY